MKTIRKAIIPAAGLGTRFLPATKAMPKEMLPIIDRPTIEYIVEEAIESGIEEIIIVTGKGKRAIEDHFDHNVELEQHLRQKEKEEELARITYSSDIDIHYIRQKEPKGLGHAVWSARHFIGQEPFAVLLGDDIVQAPVPCLKQMINVYEQQQKSVIGIQRVSPKEVSRYGIIEPSKQEGRTYHIRHLVEKPHPDQAPSNLAIIGRYLLTPAIFPLLGRQQIGAGGEIQLTDALGWLNELESLVGYEFEGERYDVGEKIGFIQTVVEFATLKDPVLQQELRPFLLRMLEKRG